MSDVWTHDSRVLVKDWCNKIHLMKQLSELTQFHRINLLKEQQCLLTWLTWHSHAPYYLNIKLLCGSSYQMTTLKNPEMYPPYSMDIFVCFLPTWLNMFAICTSQNKQFLLLLSCRVKYSHVKLLWWWLSQSFKYWVWIVVAEWLAEQDMSYYWVIMYNPLCGKYCRRIPRLNLRMQCDNCDCYFHINCVSLSRIDCHNILSWACYNCSADMFPFYITEDAELHHLLHYDIYLALYYSADSNDEHDNPFANKLFNPFDLRDQPSNSPHFDIDPDIT